MARGDGVDRISVRNVNLSNAKISNTQRHNEREKESYTNPDIVPERSEYNIHFKAAADNYKKVFTKMEADGMISTRGLKDGANLYGELIFDVNSAYFHNHGGYEFANQLTAAQEENKSLHAVAENYNCICRAYGRNMLRPLSKW